MNITSIYRDTALNSFIIGATVELYEGETLIGSFSPSGNQYELLINTAIFGIEVKSLTVYANKENYSISLVNIIIQVQERDTTIDVYLDGIHSDLIQLYNFSIGQSLNITAFYNDISGPFLSGATVQLIGEGVSEMLLLHPIYSQYNITIFAEDLGLGIHFLTVSAKKDNFTIATKNIELNVKERKTSLQLFLNGNNATDSKYIEVEIGEFINVSVFYRDLLNDTHLSPATVRLIGVVSGDFNDNGTHYNFTIDSSSLGQGINFLTVLAQKTNFESQSIVFTIEVTELNTNLHLYLNSLNKTLDKTIQVTVGDIVNVSIIYEDYNYTFTKQNTVIR